METMPVDAKAGCLYPNNARALIEEGMPPARVFSAAFGAEQPVASNADEEGRAQNRRVEMAPVPKAVNNAAPADG